MDIDFRQSHALLLDDAVAMLKADRGFVVLYDVAAHTFGEYIAARNFERLPSYWQSSIINEPFREFNHLWDLMTEIIAQGKPILTDNASSDLYYFRPTDLLSWSLRCVMVVPLVRDGVMYALLWCDQRIKQGSWTDPDLARVVDLVNQFLR